MKQRICNSKQKSYYYLYHCQSRNLFDLFDYLIFLYPKKDMFIMPLTPNNEYNYVFAWIEMSAISAKLPASIVAQYFLSIYD